MLIKFASNLSELTCIFKSRNHPFYAIFENEILSIKRECFLPNSLLFDEVHTLIHLFVVYCGYAEGL